MIKLSNIPAADVPSSIDEAAIAQIGDSFRLPRWSSEPGKAYQWASRTVMGDPSLGDFEKMRKLGWSPVFYDENRHAALSKTPEGYVTHGGLILVQKPEAQVAAAREDDKIKALVLEAIAKRALGGNAAVFSSNTVASAWRECKEAYDDMEFRNANREVIRARAEQLARRAGQTPDLMASVEAPVPCRLEGFALWFFNQDRLIPIWRLFEPLAIVQIKGEISAAK
jgi:hypothetical protein